MATLLYMSEVLADSKVVQSSPRKKFGGRKKGTPNKATADVKALAGNYAVAAMDELARLSVGADSEQARVSACKEILDRAFGKTPQAMELSGKDGEAIIIEDANPTEMARRLSFILMGGANYAEH